MAKHPSTFLLFEDVLDRDVVVLQNDLGERFTVTREAAGDIAVMLADSCDDPDLCEFVASTWQGRGWSIEEGLEEDELLTNADRVSLDDLDDDDMEHAVNADRYHPDESRIDLGGGMVVPLSELLEDDDVEDDQR